MYKVGDTVRYVKAGIRTMWGPYKKPEPKTGVIEEVFSTPDKRPCYWIKDENELIFSSQILGFQ